MSKIAQQRNAFLISSFTAPLTALARETITSVAHGIPVATSVLSVRQMKASSAHWAQRAGARAHACRRRRTPLPFGASSACRNAVSCPVAATTALVWAQVGRTTQRATFINGPAGTDGVLAGLDVPGAPRAVRPRTQSGALRRVRGALLEALGQVRPADGRVDLQPQRLGEVRACGVDAAAVRRISAQPAIAARNTCRGGRARTASTRRCRRTETRARLRARKGCS